MNLFKLALRDKLNLFNDSLFVYLKPHHHHIFQWTGLKCVLNIQETTKIINNMRLFHLVNKN